MGGISLSGLASGLDTNTMVSQLMALERKPYEALQSKKSALQENQSFIRSINTKLSTLRTAAADLMYTSSFNLTSAKVSDTSVVNVQSTEFAQPGSYQITVNQLAKQHVMGSAAKAIDGEELAELSGQKLTFYVKGKEEAVEIELRGDSDEEVMNNLMNDINNAKLGVRASVIQTSPGHKTFVLTSDKMGTEEMMVIGADRENDTDKKTYINGSAELLDALGFTERQAAQNAKVTINGIEIEHTENTLNNIVQGLTINLLKDNESSTVNVVKDADKVADRVQKFVDAYNDVVTTIRSKTGKGGSMQSDSTLRSLQDELSRMLNSSVSSNTDFRFLFEIGLEVDKGITSGSSMTGKINFDKNKFKEAFNKNAEDIYRLFANDGETEGKITKNKGIGTLFSQRLMDWTRSQTGLLAFKVSGYDSEIKSINDQMTSLEQRLNNKEQQMLRQFAAMENALSTLRNEQSWLSSQIASLSNLY